MVYARPDKGQANSDVDALLKAEVFDRDQPLIMVLRHHNIKLALARAHENRIARPGTADLNAFGPGFFNGRGNDEDFFIPKLSFFTGMRIQAGHRNARSFNPRLLTKLMGEAGGLQTG